MNTPLSELKKRIAAFDPKHQIIAYCRDPYCALAFETVKLLRSQGFHIRRLQDGFPQWKQAGLSVEQVVSVLRSHMK